MRVPRIVDGDFQYTVMEIVPVNPSGSKWMLRQKGIRPLATITPSNTDHPRAPYGVGNGYAAF